MTWKRSDAFYAACTEYIVAEVRLRYLNGIIDAAEDWATLPHGSCGAVLDKIANRAVKRPFRECIGPSLVENQPGAIVAEVGSGFPRAFAGFADSRIRRLALELVELNESEVTDLAARYRLKLEQLRSVCRTVVEDPGEFGRMDVVYVRLGPGFKPLMSP